jgi:tape measure domain-containing protein
MSENRNGGLAFKATLDIDDFNASAEAMERRIRSSATTVGYEAERMDQSILDFARNGAKYIVTYLIANGLSKVASSIVQVRGQFQQLEIAFETMLGSASKSQTLMAQMIDTAAKTPFDLTGVAMGAKQLLAYGFEAEKVNETLIRLGNIASGLSIPLGDMVYLYGTTMTQGRLYAQDMRQFMGRGIPLAKELASMYGKTTEEINAMVSAGKIGFADVEKVIYGMTDAGGQFYNLMHKQSASLTGMIANLGDAWDMALNDLGEQYQDVFAKGIEGATYLVEHLDDILRITKAIAIAYGTYKAAIVVNTIATKGYTGVALIDNTVRQAKLSLMREEQRLTGQTIADNTKLTASQIANTKALESQLTAKERLNIVSRLRVGAIQQMLTAQQQQYLSTLGLTTSSEGYESAAMGVLTSDQKLALSKLDLSSKSAIYRSALQQEILSKKQSADASLNVMRANVKSAYAKMEDAKQSAILAMQRSESARYELYWAKQSGDATKISVAEKKLEGAVENQAIARKAALASSTDFHTKKKQLETAATASSTVATTADTVAKGAATTSTNLLSVATAKLNIALKTLWASMKANPVGWVITIIGLAVSAFTMFKSKTDESTDAMGEFSDTTRKEVDNLNMLISVLKNTENGTKAHKSALDKVNAILKEYNKELIDEKTTVDQLNQKYRELTEAINESAAARVKAKYIEQYQKDQSESVTDATAKLKKEGGGLKDYEFNEITGQGYWRAIKPIQDMNQAIYDMIELQAVESAENLKNLTGDAYTKAFSDTVNRIADQVQAASGSSDKDIQAFTANISNYLFKVTESVRTLESNTNSLNESMNQFISTGNNLPGNEKVDYLSMSLSELDKIVRDTNKEIDDINSKSVSVKTDNSKLNELLNTLSEVNNAISGKEADLNTEAGIETRIKQLKDERSEVIINSKRYKELSSTIETLEKRLPKRTSKTENVESQLDEKQIQSQIRLEQARIEIMEDGHEKRRALLDLQHRTNLLAINKEEKELIKTRKEAGKGGLTSDESATFQSRRDVENKAYLKAQNKVFDDEIRYKKEQYQLYWRWVESMGKDVADQKFSKLLQNGESYKAYLETQIANLRSKQQSSALSEGETNLLINVTSELNQINGVKSAMDLFKESMTNAINEAQTLAEKIQIVADYKKKLESGNSGIINKDDQANANLFVSEQEAENQKAIQQRLANDFKSFEERKTAIVTEFGLLRMQKQVQLNEELLARINKGEADALSAVNAEQLKQSADWQNLFVNLDYLSASEIERILANIRGKLNDADLKLNPVDYNALVESLNDAKAKLIAANPFKVLGQSFSEYIKKLREVKEAQEKNLSEEEIQKLKVSANMALQNTISSIASINDMVQSVGSSISGVADSFGEDKLSQDINNITDLMGATAQAGTGVAKIISGDIVGGVKDLATGLANAVQIFNRMHDQKKERQIQQLQKEIDKLAKSYKELGDQIERAYGKDKAELIEAQNKSLEDQNKAMRRQIEAEKSKKKADKEKIKDWQDQIAENEKEIAENRKYNIVEAIIGTDIKSAIDQFADAYADAWAKGEKAAGKSADVVKDLIKKSIIETLKGKLQPEVEAFMAYLADALKDGIISDAEQRMIDDWEKRLENMTDRELAGKEKWLKNEDTVEDDPVDPLTGAISKMSEETGSVIAGKLNAMVINQGDTNKTLAEALIYQKQIEANTRVSASELVQIKESLRRIENKESSLLSQGIE